MFYTQDSRWRKDFCRVLRVGRVVTQDMVAEDAPPVLVFDMDHSNDRYTTYLLQSESNPGLYTVVLYNGNQLIAGDEPVEVVVYDSLFRPQWVRPGRLFYPKRHKLLPRVGYTWKSFRHSLFNRVNSF